jgi:ATP-dependent DNA helicase DinG
MALTDIAAELLHDLGQTPPANHDQLAAMAIKMGKIKQQNDRRVAGRGGWPWASYILDALGVDDTTNLAVTPDRAMKVWKDLPPWSDQAPAQPESFDPVTRQEVTDRLSQMLSDILPAGAEARPQQIEYADAMRHIFDPPDNGPKGLLAEAGTGTGKTLGYLAPATVWAEKNEASVCISTYTKNLQNQVEDDLSAYYEVTGRGRDHVIVRKGRENYLCLLNLQDSVEGTDLRGQNATQLGLITRWAGVTKDGDLSGGDMPGWMADLVGRRRLKSMADRRGECIYSACPHYHECFIEKNRRLSHHADIVVSNHVLTLIEAALRHDREMAGEEVDGPTRYIFDEGHHLFHAADSAFSLHLSGREMAELRRWLIGVETTRKRRQRGLKQRIGDLLEDIEHAPGLLDQVSNTARALPDYGWLTRLGDQNPVGPGEKFLHAIHDQTLARSKNQNSFYSLETNLCPIQDDVISSAKKLTSVLNRLKKPLFKISGLLRKALNEKSDELDSDTRQRIESVMHGIERRARLTIAGWRGMLDHIINDAPADDFVDWFAIDRAQGKDIDVGFKRYWIDPMTPFKQIMEDQAMGMAVTSASLLDRDHTNQTDWASATKRAGLDGIKDTHQMIVPSPFNYAEQTTVFVVNDLDYRDHDQLAAAYYHLFKASGGGALGLFTSIQRLKKVHERLLGKMTEDDMALYAQHVDGLSVPTLVDIFRSDKQASLLGTDAVRDGIDVPGDALRLVVYDRVPWPIPNLLHKARRKHFGGRDYDTMLTRFKFKQAYGRLIRREDDRGVLVMLDSRLPSRIADGLPNGVNVIRTGMRDTIKQTAKLLSDG